MRECFIESCNGLALPSSQFCGDHFSVKQLKARSVSEKTETITPCFFSPNCLSPEKNANINDYLIKKWKVKT